MLWIRFGIEILRSRRSLAVVPGMKKPNDHAKPTKVERLKKEEKSCEYTIMWYSFCNSIPFFHIGWNLIGLCLCTLYD